MRLPKKIPRRKALIGSGDAKGDQDRLKPALHRRRNKRVVDQYDPVQASRASVLRDNGLSTMTPNLPARGLIAILFALYSGKNAREILATHSSVLFERLGLRQHLTLQRSNGLKSMVARIRAEAETALRQPIDPAVTALERRRRFRVIQGGSVR